MYCICIICIVYIVDCKLKIESNNELQFDQDS